MTALPSSPTPPPVEWDVRPPPGGSGDGGPSWLDDIHRFRARVLYDGGLRPSFRADDGSYRDVDPVDVAAHHVKASDGGDIVGSFRVLPLAGAAVGLGERLLGGDGMERLLATVGCRREEAWEGGGWVVDPARRGTGLGLRLLAAGIAEAERLGLPVVIGAAGVRYGQYRTLARVGCRRVPGFDVVPVPELADDLTMVYAVSRALPSSFRCLVARAEADIRVRGLTNDADPVVVPCRPSRRAS